MSRPALTKPLSDAQVRAILDAYQRPEFRVEGQRNALYALQYQGLVRRVAYRVVGAVSRAEPFTRRFAVVGRVMSHLTINTQPA